MTLQQVARVGLPARLRANFGASLGAAPTSAAGECAGASLAVRFAPRSPASLPLARESLGTRSGVGRGRRQDRQTRRESAGRDGKQRRRARGFGKAQIAASGLQWLSAHPVLDRGCPHRCRDRPFGAVAAANQGDPPWAVNFHRQQCRLMRPNLPFRTGQANG
jgi:hypothetical protein